MIEFLQPQFVTGAGSNDPVYSSPAFDAKLIEAERALDPNQSYALVNQALVVQARVASVNARVFAYSALLSLPFAAWLGGPLQVSASGWAVVMYLGVVATGMAYLLFSIGLRGMSAATGVALSKAEPITAFALSLLVVGERPAWWSILGLMAVIAGLWLVVKAEQKNPDAV